MNKIKLFFVALMACLVMNSCQGWLELYPEGETLLEDFWKSADDIESVVATCYLSLMEDAYIQRAVVWGELRSDNMEHTAKSGVDLLDMFDVNLQATNAYCDWTPFYQTINYCNTVIHYAPQVMEEDENLSQTAMEAFRAEARAIRALSYFYLVRAFGDVPLVTQPTIDDSNGFDIAKTNGDEILRYLINDLEVALTYAQNSFGSYRDDYNKNRFTKQSIRALMADIYLWLNDYENCVRVCDDFLAYDAKLKLQNKYAGYILEDASMYLSQFSQPSYSSTESIFATGHAASTRTVSLTTFYGKEAKDPVVAAAQEFHTNPYRVFISPSTDKRYTYAYTTSVSESPGYQIAKYVYSSVIVSGGTKMPNSSVSERDFVFYRLPDIYLMRAEALVEMADAVTAYDEQQAYLNDAIYMVNKTFMRANPDRLALDTLSLKIYGDVDVMRELVLDERRREFMFEGKRWFDLVRHSRRQGTAQVAMDAVEGKNYPNSSEHVALNKMSTLDALYMPISQTEVQNNKKMVQNPFYEMTSTTGKNE